MDNNLNRKDEIELAKDILDWLFLNHEHVFGLDESLFVQEEAKTIEGKLFEGHPFVFSLELENLIKNRYPELKDYWYGKIEE